MRLCRLAVTAALGVLMAYSPNADLLNAIRSYNGPIPKNVLLATTLAETGGNPYGPAGDNNQSFGAWQEYSQGRGKGLTPAQRRDPVASTQRAIREFTQYWNKGLRGGALAAAAQRPRNPGAYAAKVDSLLGVSDQLLGLSGVAQGQLGAPGVASASGATGDGRKALGAAALLDRRPDESFTSSVKRQMATGAFQLGSRPLADGPPVGAQSPQGNAAADSAVVGFAKKYLGTPYSWGGGTPNGPGFGIGRGANTRGFDCSSLVQYAWAKVGVKLPRTTDGQIKAGRAVRHLSDARPGDLLFPSKGHVQMYIGNGMVIESPRTGLSVRTAPLRSSYIAIRRPGG